MRNQHYKNLVLSLSACSIPVMLAVIGYSAAASATHTRATTVAGSDYFAVSHLKDGACDPDHSGQAAVVEDELIDAEFSQDSQNLSSWICLSPDNQHLWVSDGRDALIFTYRFTDSSGNIELVHKADAIGTVGNSNGQITGGVGGWVDLDLSDDGEYLFQVFGASGAVGVYEVDGGELTLVEVLTG